MKHATPCACYQCTKACDLMQRRFGYSDEELADINKLLDDLNARLAKLGLAPKTFNGRLSDDREPHA